MPTVTTDLIWIVLVFFPPMILTACVAAATMAALLARRSATRRHCLEVLRHLVQYAGALRARR
jgi:hypothetical protein